MNPILLGMFAKQWTDEQQRKERHRQCHFMLPVSDGTEKQAKYGLDTLRQKIQPLISPLVLADILSLIRALFMKRRKGKKSSKLSGTSTRMTPEQHRQRHHELHMAFDELVADYIAHTKKSPTAGKSILQGTNVLQLMEWSYEQTQSPTETAE